MPYNNSSRRKQRWLLNGMTFYCFMFCSDAAINGITVYSE
ncbi:putative membrane protein [Escherichia coli P0304799.3]|nr:putative membrane protein [Escherichia coli P0304799.3]